MKVSKKDYKEYVKGKSKKSPLLKNCIMAFIFGGAICCAGQGLIALYKCLGMSKDLTANLASVTLIFLGAFLTGLDLYDNLAKHAGAGTLVPITGFANAVVSPSIEFKSEGLVLGLAAKMFVIAGPVIVYGIVASAIYGVFYYVFGVLL